MPEYTLDPTDTLRLVRQRQFRGDSLVCLDADWGWKLWFWFPGMPGISFEAWWMRQETLTLFLELPGDKYFAEGSIECCALWESRRRTGIAYFGLLDLEDSTFLIWSDRRYLSHRGYTGQRNEFAYIAPEGP